MKNKYIINNELPNNLFAEQAILNILFLNPILIQTIQENLKPEVFYKESYKIIYQTIVDLFEKNYSISPINILASFEEKGILEKIGGIDEIGRILNQSQNIADLNFYLQILNETYLRRLIIKFGKEIVIAGFNTSENLEKILEEIETKIFSLNQKKLTEKIYSSTEIIDQVFSEIKIKIAKNENIGFQTSFKDLDTILQGFQKSDLIIIAGRPSMGKTALALNLGKNIVEKYNIPLIIFSLEMSRQQIMYRFLSTEANINSNRLKSGKMTHLEWKNLTNCMRKFSELPIFIDDNPIINLSEIRSKIKKILGKNKTSGIIIIDYLQLMRISLKLENRAQEISYITRNLKILARELEIPILLLSQLSRNVESRVNKRPLLSDLRESGCKASSNLEEKELNFLKIWGKTSFYELASNFHFSNKGFKPTFLVTLTNKKNFIVTANHKILSINGWTTIHQLKKGGKIIGFQKNSILAKIKIQEYTVENIKYKGLYLVEDETIPLFHNYIENEIVFHNSIEQDADVVIMIYREEYYNEKSSNSQITELIVAKHRNGSLGTVNLSFNPTITSYKDL